MKWRISYGKSLKGFGIGFEYDYLYWWSKSFTIWFLWWYISIERREDVL